MGVKATSKEIVERRLHPSDNKRFLYSLSEFPHLMKDLRNRLLQTSFDTPDGMVNKLLHKKLKAYSSTFL